MTKRQTYRTAISRFLESAEKYADRPALVSGDKVLTYNDLAQRAHEIALRLAAVGDDRPFVGVIADKSPACYAAILGILMAGKAYLPLNPRFPASRNQFMLDRAGVAHVIREGALQFHHSKPVTGIEEDPAYLLFTSGTTGEPKGVQISNQNLGNYLEFMLGNYDLQPEDRFTQNFDLTFDLSVHDMFLCWSAGACLCVPEDASSFGMARHIRENKITCWFSVPSVAMLMDRMRLLKAGAFPSLRLSFFCGEALYLQTAEAWRRSAPNSRLVNLYGPTEATIAISRYEIPADTQLARQELGIVSIGKLFEGNHFFIHEPAEDGTGQLCLAGPQVIKSYFLNPKADELAFLELPEFPDKCYKTGDLVRQDAEGYFFFLGRLDAEVKVSGYRVNMKEIENHLQKYGSVDQCVVLYNPREGGQGELVAFLTLSQGVQPTELELDGYCKQSLPWYMVPGKFIFVDEFPLNVNGKVDRAGLKKKYLDGE